VGTFVSTNIRQLFDQVSVKTVDSNGEVIIKGEVKKFFVREESTYKSTVEIHLTVIDQDGKTLWNGLASIEASNRIRARYVNQRHPQAIRIYPSTARPSQRIRNPSE
jgi:hypothetical protein